MQVKYLEIYVCFKSPASSSDVHLFEAKVIFTEETVYICDLLFIYDYYPYLFLPVTTQHCISEFVRNLRKASHVFSFFVAMRLVVAGSDLFSPGGRHVW